MIVFVSNFLNHHQMPVAEKLFELTGGDYRFIEQIPMPEAFRKGGYPTYDNAPFLIQAWRSAELASEAKRLILNADTVIFGNIDDYSIIRRRLMRGKLTFECGERWFKRGWINFLSPRLVKSQLYYHLFFRNKPLYRLNASAYAANDMAKLRSFKNKMFKWGYFTQIPSQRGKDLGAQSDFRLKILWVARFLSWKHPGLPVLMAKQLRDRGYIFELNMYGSGPEFENTAALIKRFGLSDFVNLCGNKPNDRIIDEMRNHDVFLFTSDRNEGWGAVVNEAMSCGCAVVASDTVGSVPFLIEDGVNGMIFKSGNVKDISNKVENLLTNRDLCRRIGDNASRTMQNIWSPANAAASILTLIKGINNGTPDIILSGPCSPAYPIEI